LREKAFSLASAAKGVFGTPTSPGGREPPKTPGGRYRAARDSARWCGHPFRAADHRRVAQSLRAVRWPGHELFQRSEMKAGPLHVPTALRASAQERSALALRFVAPLWRAPLVQSASGGSLRSHQVRHAPRHADPEASRSLRFPSLAARRGLAVLI